MKKELFRNFDTNRLVFEDMPEGDTASAAAEGGEAAPAADAPAEPAEASGGAATCPKCGGEMSEGHTCPAPAAEDAPAEGGEAAPAAEGEGEMHPAAPKAPATEAPKEEKKGFFASLFGKK